MGFRLVLKSVTLNDLERRNGPYFALFHRIFVYDGVAEQLLGLPDTQTRVTTIHFASSTTHAKCNYDNKYFTAVVYDKTFCCIFSLR